MSATAEATGTLQQALAHAQQLLTAQPALAEQQAQAILQALPGHPLAQLLEAQAQLAQDRIAPALATLQALAASQPQAASVHATLAEALARAGQGEAAMARLQQALALDPNLPGGWRRLGDHLGAMERHAEAEAAYARHARHSIRDPELLRAADALASNRLPEAETRLREHLKRAPTDVAAIRMLAELAARIGRLEDAEALLSRCLQLAPGFREARHHYALVLHRGNQPQRALEQIDQLLQLEPGNPSYRNLKAVLLCRNGDYAPALELYAGILAEYPGQPKIWLSYGHALKTAGQTGAAIQAYLKVIEQAPEFGEAWWSLANLKTFRFSAAQIETMRVQLARQELDAEHRLHFDFALGKALEDRAEYAASMQHYQRGNALRKQRVPYRADDTAARVQRSIETFNAEFFAARAGYGNPAADPIFVVGLPRSGSTLVEQILSSHSAIEGTMELPELISIARELRASGPADDPLPYYPALAALDAEAARALGERYLQNTRIQRKSDRPLFIDKMPNNFAHIALIHLALPNARIIDVRRHPLACCFSGFKQHFARGQNFSYDLADIGRYYRDYVRLMAHYDAVLPGRIHRLIYEDLVDNTEAQVRGLLDYCGLPFEPACLRFFENERPVRTASSEQVRRPINRDGLEQWRHYAEWLDPLKAELGPLLTDFRSPPPVVAGGGTDPIDATT